MPNTKDKTLMVQLTDGNVLTADVSDASFMSASGSSTSLRQLEVGTGCSSSAITREPSL